MRSNQRADRSVRVAILMTGAAARPYGLPRPVVNTCTVMPAASCIVPHTKSPAGVAANTSPLRRTRSPWDSTSAMALVPDFAMHPSVFSTMFTRPPALLPGDGLALRSMPPAAR